jgi:hypothetical protein
MVSPTVCHTWPQYACGECGQEGKVETVGVWQVLVGGTCLSFDPKSRNPHPHPHLAPVDGYLPTAGRYPPMGTGYPLTGTGYPLTGTGYPPTGTQGHLYLWSC